jgi:DNA-binding response OmpR family regulator
MPAPKKARKTAVGKVAEPSVSDAADLATATAVAAKKRDGKRVLLVDDDTEIVESMRTVLESRGYEILVARDGNQGLMMAEKEDPDLVVLDMMMPKRSGFLVLEKLRRSRPVPMKVIMITANEGSRHKAYAEMLGVDDYIRKPFAMDRLLSSIDKLLS